jgi:uncharacterized protein (DUF885 family)
MTKFSLQIFAVVSLVCGAACARKGAGTAANDQLKQVLDEEWQWELRSNPESATMLGDNRYNGEWTDYSPAGFRTRAEETRKFLRRAEQVDSLFLSEQNKLNRVLMIRKLRDGFTSYTMKDWEMPVDQMNGIHLMWAQLPGYTRFAGTSDYDDYLKRLHKLPLAFDQVQQDLQLGIKDSLLPPRYLLDKVVQQAEQIGSAAEAQSPFAVPVKNFPDGVPQSERARIRDAVYAAIKDEVSPAYRRFAEWVRKEYAPHGRSDPGAWSLPHGDARYREAVRVMTTTHLTPEQFHNIGLKQVELIEADMQKLAQSQGFGSIASFNQHIKSDQALYAKSGDEILALYRNYINQMRPKMPLLFNHQPRARLDVEPMEDFRARNAAQADYSPGSMDGQRPGRVNVNEWDAPHRLTISIEATAYHEGIPGHHQQIALAQELTGIPPFRQNGNYNAFAEGWGLYAERLGKEMGFYQNPYSDYGRLQNDMWRAVRLVVDTGVHYKHWTREQMVDFFHAHTAIDEPNIQAEVDRYIAWPGQALGYKAGQLKILELRERARHQLGSRFDIRAFHDAVLENGALPLDVLDERISNWIVERKQ